jgi:hypothetical protein
VPRSDANGGQPGATLPWGVADPSGAPEAAPPSPERLTAAPLTPSVSPAPPSSAPPSSAPPSSAPPPRRALALVIAMAVGVVMLGVAGGGLVALLGASRSSVMHAVDSGPRLDVGTARDGGDRTRDGAALDAGVADRSISSDAGPNRRPKRKGLKRPAADKRKGTGELGPDIYSD